MGSSFYLFGVRRMDYSFFWYFDNDHYKSGLIRDMEAFKLFIVSTFSFSKSHSSEFASASSFFIKMLSLSILEKLNRFRSYFYTIFLDSLIFCKGLAVFEIYQFICYFVKLHIHLQSKSNQIFIILA